MNCPVCKKDAHETMSLHSEGFYEDLCECSICGSSWSINHGLVKVFTDSQESSFMEGITETVESDDYCFAA